MSSIDGGIGPTAPRGQRNAGISLLLVGFTIVVALACVVFLSVTLTQTRVASATADGVVASIPKLDYVGRRWAALRYETAKQRLLEAESSSLSLMATAADLELRSVKAKLEDLLASFYHRIAASEPEFAGLIHQRGYPDQYGRIQGAKVDLVKRHDDLAAVIDDIGVHYRAWRQAEATTEKAAAELKIARQRVFDLKTQIAEASRANFALIKADLDKDADARARIENAFYELNINNYDCGVKNDDCGLLGGYVSRAYYRLLTLRSDLLTLTLVILMGVLGSALQISHAYFMKNQVQTVGGYFQRISVGAMTALVIFIVAKAGVPVLADPTRLGGDAPINPYFVSFLAIVSGLLSENAIANVQAQGAKLFGAGSSGPKRWARADFSGGLTDQGLSLPYLSQQLGLEEADTTAMLKGSKPLEPEQQKLVAIYLRASIRDLFTDIPPAT